MAKCVHASFGNLQSGRHETFGDLKILICSREIRKDLESWGNGLGELWRISLRLASQKVSTWNEAL